MEERTEEDLIVGFICRSAFRKSCTTRTEEDLQKIAAVFFNTLEVRYQETIFFFEKREYFKHLYSMLWVFEAHNSSKAQRPLTEESIKKFENQFLFYRVPFDEEIVVLLDAIRSTSYSQIRNIPINEIESISKIIDYCELLLNCYSLLTLPGFFSFENSYTLDTFYRNRKMTKRLDMLETYVIEKAFELIGYWKAKSEKRENNPGADAMKKRGEENAKAIEDVLDVLKITDTSIFRHDKKLREQFFSLVKKKADCTSEDRILKIARSFHR